ncbi:MAG: SPL family radical SAM protein [Gemmatimonadaceae bacterium]
MTQGTFFADADGPRALPVIGEQSDIRYYGVTARSVLNGPETTGMGFWSVNPYVGCAFGCAYCYARYTHRYVMERSAAGEVLDAALRQDAAAMPTWLAFERRIFVKRNAPERLRRALRHGSARHLALLNGESIVIGTATDPYQPAERRFRLTRGILEVLAEHPGLDVTIITKSPLVTRDVDVLGRLARHSRVSVHVSLITVDRELARRLEPRAPTPEARLRAIARLSAAGLDVGVNVMPVLPGITDDPAALERLVARVAAAGAAHVGACALRLQHEARRRYLPFIEQEFPHLAERYRATYARSANAGARYREGLRQFFRRLRARYGIAAYAYETDDDGDEAPEPAGPPERQMDLFAADERPAPGAPNGADGAALRPPLPADG